MFLRRTTDPSTEPVTTAEAEEKLVLGSNWDSVTLTRQISAARIHVEEITDKSLITQSWTLKLDKWPKNDTIYLPKGLVQSITSFTYVDADGDTQIMVQDTDYYLANNGDEARLTPVTSWPSVSTTQQEVISVEYVTGYGDAATDVPDWATEAVLALTEYYYSSGENKGAFDYFGLVVRPHKVFFNYEKNA